MSAKKAHFIDRNFKPRVRTLGGSVALYGGRRHDGETGFDLDRFDDLRGEGRVRCLHPNGLGEAFFNLSCFVLGNCRRRAGGTTDDHPKR